MRRRPLHSAAAGLWPRSRSSVERKAPRRDRPVQCGAGSRTRWPAAGVESALDLLERHGVELDGPSYASLLRKCGSGGCRSADAVRRIHSHLAGNGKLSSVDNVLLEAYGKCASSDEARRFFDSIDVSRKRASPFPWNIMMGAYCNDGRPRQALELLKAMEASPDRVTFVTGLTACSQLRCLEEGKALHNQFVASGLKSSVVLDCSLVNMYGRCGRLDEARKLFEAMPVRNVVCWNTMIAAYAQNGQEAEAMKVYRRMEPEGRLKPDRITYLNVLTACCSSGDLEQGRQVHDQIVAAGLDGDITMGNALVNMYGKCGCAEEARLVFQGMKQRDIVSWNALIAALVQQGHCKEAFEVFRSMDVKPDGITFTSVLGAFCSPEDLEEGRAVHSQVLASGVELNVVLQTALLNMYRKCGSLGEARAMFEKMQHRTIVTWNAMIAGYVQFGLEKEAFELYRRLDMPPADVTFVSLLQVCSSLDQVKQLHGQIKQLGLELDMQVGNGLVSAYSRACSLDDAMAVFKSMRSRDVVTWTAIIGALVEQGQARRALHLYREMALDGVRADCVACVGALDACTSISDLVEGRKIHRYVQDCNMLETDVFVGSALVNLYAKCGIVVEARGVFDEMHYRNVITWNTMIGAYAQHGYAGESLDLYEQMELDGTRPDSVTFLCILFACSHIGSVSRGREYFQSMVEDYQVDPVQSHYCCMVDVLARAGWMQEAEELVKCMPVQPGPVAWTTLLGGCNIHHDFERGVRAAEHAHHLDPAHKSKSCLLLSDICGTGSSISSALVQRRARKGFQL